MVFAGNGLEREAEVVGLEVTAQTVSITTVYGEIGIVDDWYPVVDYLHEIIISSISSL